MRPSLSIAAPGPSASTPPTGPARKPSRRRSARPRLTATLEDALCQDPWLQQIEAAALADEVAHLPARDRVTALLGCAIVARHVAKHGATWWQRPARERAARLIHGTWWVKRLPLFYSLGRAQAALSPFASLRAGAQLIDAIETAVQIAHTPMWRARPDDPAVEALAARIGPGGERFIPAPRTWECRLAPRPRGWDVVPQAAMALWTIMQPRSERASSSADGLRTWPRQAGRVQRMYLEGALLLEATPPAQRRAMTLVLTERLGTMEEVARLAASATAATPYLEALPWLVNPPMLRSHR